MKKKSINNPKFLKFKLELMKKGMTIVDFSKEAGYSTAGFYQVFINDREDKINYFFDFLKNFKPNVCK